MKRYHATDTGHMVVTQIKARIHAEYAKLSTRNPVRYTTQAYIQDLANCADARGKAPLEYCLLEAEDFAAMCGNSRLVGMFRRFLIRAGYYIPMRGRVGIGKPRRFSLGAEVYGPAAPPEDLTRATYRTRIRHRERGNCTIIPK